MTFKNHGRLKLGISSPPNSLADSKATYMIATGVISGDKTIVGNLFDSEDNLIARKRVYCYQGQDRNIPFPNLGVGHTGYLSGERPALAWGPMIVRLWMHDRQTRDEDGNVKDDDPFYYEIKDTIAQLLDQIDRGKDEN